MTTPEGLARRFAVVVTGDAKGRLHVPVPFDPMLFGGRRSVTTSPGRSTAAGCVVWSRLAAGPRGRARAGLEP